MWEMIEARVDWITATAKKEMHVDQFSDVGTRLLEAGKKVGGTTREANFQGYQGYASSGVFFGWRSDGAVIRASGNVAGQQWQSIAAAADNVSRFDLAVTSRSDVEVDGLAQSYYRRLPSDPKTNGRPIEYTLIQRKRGGDTLYCGSRASEKFGRIYDKHRESGGKYPPNSWRFEVEYKADTAKNVSARLATADVSELAIAGAVARRFIEWKCPPPIELPPPDWRDDGRYQETSNETRFRWLKDSVALSVEKLLVSYSPDEIRDALGLRFFNADLPRSFVHLDKTYAEDELDMG